MSSEKSLAEEFNISSPTSLGQGAGIMIVEDQQDMRLIVAHHLNKMGFKKTFQYGDAMDAVEFLKNKESPPIDILICSMEIPGGLSGIDFLQELKENPILERGPFIMSMANPSKEKIMLTTESGADEILVKPFSLKDILPKIKNAFTIYHNPKNPEKVYELAKRQFREEKYDEAKKIYSRIAQATEKAARPCVGLARVEAKLGNVDGALKLLEEAQNRNKHYVHTYVVRGEILSAQKKIDAAIEQYKTAIELSPLNPMRYENAAQLLFDQKRYEEAIQILEVAVRNELNFSSLHHYLSQGYYAVKDYKKAIKHIRSALGLNPENVVYLNQLGISYKESGLIEEATKTYNSIIKLDPNNKAALYNKAILMHSTGAADEAIKILSRLVGKYPDFEQAKTKLAEYQKGKGGQQAS
ncbi:MAG: tetratricopeptide repeat protein [Oligoflexales bacterium]